VATRFGKWGMTNGPAAALALSTRLLGGRMDWANAFASWSPHELSGLTTALQANLEVGSNLAEGWLTPSIEPAHCTPEHSGVVSSPPWHLQARSNVHGREEALHRCGNVRCTDHDSPPTGTLLEGPATRDLTPSS
jgi:hypothetical protein